MKQIRVDELMDDPALDPTRHAQALVGLARLNAASFGAKHLWNEIARVARTHSTKTIRLLEIASGGGDIVLDLVKRAEAAGLDLKITGSDLSPTAVEIAQRKFSRISPSVNFIPINALTDQFPDDFDIVTTSLFTHHLEPEQVSLLLKKMYAAARKCVIVSDLERSDLNYLLVWIATRMLTRSDVVHYDGPVSVRAAYTAEEFMNLAKKAGVQHSSIKRVFPCRFIYTSAKDAERLDNRI